MTDKELLEWAAKAAGIELEWDARGPYEVIPGVSGNDRVWNPLTDDGDALRLAVKLKINIDMDDQSAWTRKHGVLIQEYWGGDYDPSYKHAIVRAAAALGQQGSK